MMPLVLIPGMMCDSRLFSPQIAAFSATNDIHLASINEYDSIEELAANVLKNAPEQFALLGLSMGGIVAMEMTKQAPERVLKLALIDTNPKAEIESRQLLRNKQITDAKHGKLKSIIADEMKPNYLVDSDGKEAILDLCMEMALDLGDEVFINQSKALQNRPDQQKTLESIDVPTLLMCGEFDRLCPIEYHQAMHETIKNSQLIIVENAGHLPTLEQPFAANKAIEYWLQT